ncbi:ribosome-associated heat shock protein Hsp15 [Rhodopseudomonas julia]|uniref:Ribosome-associated heat shock protein Hsp15 n=1 Tax=Rhodopseudomonas julia TaxID=200617 RepID=A0ABU0C5V4_9BRAD|nr:RNA-binding S4 domain-containing protein [Rhodopseudomonas julia]MDQ0325901.1 ribosome-associated heat shock protein Hsp15 [Rhodopseudomonas julia]
MAKASADEAGTREAQRLDRWLWHARFVRTRSAAQKFISDGHVRINRQKADQASRLVRIGDVLTLALPAGVKVVEALGFAERRGSFSVAATLYREIGASGEASRDESGVSPEATHPPAPQHRPSPRERRALIAMKRRS